jgi:nicotinamidase-related amidase
VSSLALLVLDPQRDFFHADNPHLDEFNAALAVTNQAIEMFRTAGRPVVVALHTSGAKPEGSWEHGIWDEFQIDPGDVRVKKGSVDAFWDSSLGEVLQGLAVDRVVLAGFLSDMCVLGSYFGALVRGYEPRVLEGATAALDGGFRAHVEALVRTVALETLSEELGGTPQE